MKSLRKIALSAGVVLLTLGLAFLPLRARTHQNPAPQQGSATGAQSQTAPPAEKSQTPAAPAQQPQQAPGIKVQVNQVIVPVTVKDGAGRLVPDLRRDEFRIFEDNVEQKIASFSAEVVPLSLVILVDNDLEDKYARQVASSLDSMVAALSTDDEAFVCRYDQFFHEGKGFTKDQDKLLTELKRTRLGEEPSTPPTGTPIDVSPTINNHSAIGDSPKVPETTMIIKGQPTKALDDAVYAAAQLLKDRDPERRRRKIILLVSDGLNNLKLNTNKYDTVIKELLRYDISVYGVGVGASYFNRKFEHLAKYTKDSGGDIYYGLKRESLEEFYSRVTEEARNQYTLAYAPAGTDRNADYHSIEVRVRRPGLSILTREGYYTGVAR